MANYPDNFGYSREWTDEEAFPSISYTKDWNSSDDFPTIETDETQVRADMQSLYNEIKDYLNGTNESHLDEEHSWEGHGLKQYMQGAGEGILEEAAASATEAQSYAKGGTDTRTGEDTDNAKYYKEQTKILSDRFFSEGISVLFGIEQYEGYAPDELPLHGGYMGSVSQVDLMFSAESPSATALAPSILRYANGDLILVNAKSSDSDFADKVSALTVGVPFYYIAEGENCRELRYYAKASGSSVTQYVIARFADTTGEHTVSALNYNTTWTVESIGSYYRNERLPVGGDEKAIDVLFLQNAGPVTQMMLLLEKEAGDSATEAQSYAKGGTSSRAGEDTDNAKYYSEQAASSATIANTEAEAAEAWATGGEEGTPSATNNALYYAGQASSFATTASNKASDASDSATAAAGSATAATQAKNASAASAATAESYAKGGTETRTGEDTDNAKYYSEQAREWATGYTVGEPSGTNNARYYAGQASTHASVAEGAAASAGMSVQIAASWATGGTTGTPGATNNAKYYSEQASGSATTASNKASDASDSATSASGSASTASAKATLAESWAVGGTNTRPGEDTNNAKYWSEQAQAAAGGGVSSFNGRTGSVTPQSGDYTAVMVGADASGSASAVQSSLDTHVGNTSNPHSVTAAQVGALAEPSNAGTVGQVLTKTASGSEWAETSPGLLPRLTVTGITTGSAVTATRNGEIVTLTEASGTWTGDLPKYGAWTVTATLGGDTASDTVSVDAVKQYSLTLKYTHIYGVSWDGTSTTAWTRTDKAASFTDPVPYVSGMTAEQCSSPFDSIMPWSGMVKSERTGGTMVAIPKFWYKITQTGDGIKIQIADAEVDGFSVSPAHMDRGDGKGERDVVYVGRYHCATSTYKSTTGVNPMASQTRATFRTQCHSIGTDYWLMGWPLRFTLFLLYLVEFADWNTQAKIGYGCGKNFSVGSMGYTDSMPYHTGTTQASRTTYGLGTQYRNIEGLWDNVRDWIDECYNSSNGLMIILNPASSSDSSGGVSVGTPSDGYPSKFSCKDVSGTFPLFIPSEASGSESTYSCDGWGFNAGSPCVFAGGSSYNPYGSCGLFYWHYNAATYTDAGIGGRLQELP